MKLKRMLAVLLTMVLFAGLLPMTVFATESSEEPSKGSYPINLTGSDPVVVLNEVIKILAEDCADPDDFVEGTDTFYLDLNNDGEKDVLVDRDAYTAKRLPGADKLESSVSIPVGSVSEYESIIFIFPAKYSVTFVDDNGTVLKETTKYAENTPVDQISKPGDPTKLATAQYTYTFAGWVNAGTGAAGITAVTGDVTYKASYSSTVNKYTVIFVDESGAVLEFYDSKCNLVTSVECSYGTSVLDIGVVLPIVSEKNNKGDSFIGWTNTSTGEMGIKDVTADATYQATYEGKTTPDTDPEHGSGEMKYTITFLDERGVVIAFDYGNNEGGSTQATSVKYSYGTSANNIHVPGVPGKNVNGAPFIGWKNTKTGEMGIKDVYADATYQATYANKYKITFVDEDGTVLKEATEYDYGTSAADIVKPADPTKPATAQYTYAFADWVNAGTGAAGITDVTGDVTYKAGYNSTVRKYKITFVDEDGKTVLKEATEYEYGTSAADIAKPADPAKLATAQYTTYTFSHWVNVKTGEIEIKDVTADATYKARYLPQNKGYYNVVEGEGTGYREGTGGSLIFVFKRTVDDETAFDHFIGIMVDGKAMVHGIPLTPGRQYIAQRGSVIIELLPEFLNTLSAGSHTITACFDDGDDVDVHFTVSGTKESSTEKPAEAPTEATRNSEVIVTGDEFHIRLWVSLLLISALGIVSALAVKKRTRR